MFDNLFNQIHMDQQLLQQEIQAIHEHGQRMVNESEQRHEELKKNLADAHHRITEANATIRRLRAKMVDDHDKMKQMTEDYDKMLANLQKLLNK